MAFKALRKRLERGDISDPHTYIELYAQAYEETDDEKGSIDIADHLYNDLPPDGVEAEDDEQRQVADVLALRSYMDKSATENYDPDQERDESGRWSAGGAVGAVAGAVAGGAKLYAENMGILIHDHKLVKDISWAVSDTAADIPRIAKGIFNRMTLGTGPLAIGAVKLGLRVAPVAFHLFVGAVTGLAKAGMWTAKKVTGNVDHAADAMDKLDELAELLKNDPEERADFERAIQVIIRDHPEILDDKDDEDTPNFNMQERDKDGKFKSKKKKDDEEPAKAPEADPLAFGATGGGESFAAGSGAVDNANPEGHNQYTNLSSTLKTAVPELGHIKVFSYKAKPGRTPDPHKYVLASTHEKYGTPQTVPGHKEATGIAMKINPETKHVHFQELNSHIKGAGKRMVEAVIKHLPDHTFSVTDWSQASMDDSERSKAGASFWTKMASKHAGKFVE